MKDRTKNQKHRTKVQKHRTENQKHRIGIAIAPINDGTILSSQKIAIISEQQLFGERVKLRRKKRQKNRDPEVIIRQLDDLQEGSPVVHEEHGVGRYLGLITLFIFT